MAQTTYPSYYQGGPSFYITYIDQNDVQKDSYVSYPGPAGNPGTIMNDGSGSFGWRIGLNPGDGIKRVLSIDFSNGDSDGLCSLVLCKPIASVHTRDLNAGAEFDLLTSTGGKLPRIYDGANLSMIMFLNSNDPVASALGGSITTIWR